MPVRSHQYAALALARKNLKVLTFLISVYYFIYGLCKVNDTESYTSLFVMGYLQMIEYCSRQDIGVYNNPIPTLTIVLAALNPLLFVYNAVHALAQTWQKIVILTLYA